MGAFEKALLKKKYGWSGQKYRNLMNAVIKENYQEISTRVLNSDKRRFAKNVKDTLPKESKKSFVIPDVSNVVRTSPTIRKSADRGELLAKTMREDIRKVMKRAMLSANVTTTQGTVRKSIAREAEKELKSYFEGYTKKHPKYKMPSNIHSIAVTETRSVINQVRQEYSQRIVKENEDYEIIKTWKNNPSLSKESRLGHSKITGQSRKLNEMFRIPIYRKVQGRWRFMGQHLFALHPHADNLPAEEVITCNCEVIYSIKRKKKK